MIDVGRSVVGRSGMAFSSACGSAFGGIEVCMVVTDVGEVGLFRLIEDVVSAGGVAGKYGNVSGRGPCSGIVVR